MSLENDRKLCIRFKKKFKIFSSLVTNIINTIKDLLYINID